MTNTWWETFWNEEFPDAVPRDVGLAIARGILARLYGPAVLAAVTPEAAGECGDCERGRELVLYGQVSVCWRCAFRRHRVHVRLEEAA